MKNEAILILKSDDKCTWIAVLDQVSGSRGRYTVYRLSCSGDKRADIVGRELDLRTARKTVAKSDREAVASGPNFDHDCDWRKATLMLAKCVALTLQTNGKIGVGSGMVMKVVNGKRIVERWDKDFVEAMAFIGLEMGEKVTNKEMKRPRGRAAKAA